MEGAAFFGCSPDWSVTEGRDGSDNGPWRSLTPNKNTLANFLRQGIFCLGTRPKPSHHFTPITPTTEYIRLTWYQNILLRTSPK